MPLPPRLVVAVAAAVVVWLVVPPALAQTRSGRRSGSRSKRAAKAPPAWPAFEARHGEWVRRKEMAVGAGTAEPDPLWQYLVSEVIVTGVFETEDGMGVFVHATPTGNTFFARPGAELYNGRLVEVRPGASGFADAAEAVFAERSHGGAVRSVVKRVETVPAPAPTPTPTPTPAPIPATP